MSYRISYLVCLDDLFINMDIREFYGVISCLENGNIQKKLRVARREQETGEGRIGGDGEGKGCREK